jgi:hypothetical protein
LRWIIPALLLCASNALADIRGFGAPPSVGGSGETNTYTSSKTFHSDVLLRGTGRIIASSATFTYGISAGTGTFSSTVAVRGDAFSVGTSSFVVSEGNFAFGAAAPTAGQYVTMTRPSKTLRDAPGPTLDVLGHTYIYSTATGLIGSEFGTVRLGQQVLKTTGGGSSSYDNAGTLLISAPPSCFSGTACLSSSTILMGGSADHKIEVANNPDLAEDGHWLTIKAGNVSPYIESGARGGSLRLEGGLGNDSGGIGDYPGGNIDLQPGQGLSGEPGYGNVRMVLEGGKVGIATASPSALFTIGNGTFTVHGGSATVAYRMTAGSFAGDGSALTNLPGGSGETNTFVSSKTFHSDVLLRGTGKIQASSATFTYGITAATGAFTSTVTMTGDLIFNSPGVYTVDANQFAFSGKRLGYPNSGLYFNALGDYEFKDLAGTVTLGISAVGGFITGTQPYLSINQPIAVTGANGYVLSSGSMTASAFFGDGANITNVTATESNTMVSSKTFTTNVLAKASVTASGFFGNGSGLTGVTATESNTMVSSKTFTTNVLVKASMTASGFFMNGSTVPTLSGVTKVQTTTDQVFYSSAAAPVNLGSNITGLSFALASNTSYYFEYDIIHESTATTTGVWFGMTYPAKSTITWSVIQFSSLSASLSRFSRGAEFTSLSGTDVDVANQEVPARLWGTITTAAAGTLQPRVKCELQTGRGQINAGSSGRLMER